MLSSAPTVQTLDSNSRLLQYCSSTVLQYYCVTVLLDSSTVVQLYSTVISAKEELVDATVYPTRQLNVGRRGVDLCLY